MRPKSLASSEWSLTQKGFARLLHSLDGDLGQAADKYEKLRQGLVRFFDWRGARSPEDCVDITFDRVAKRLDAGETIEDVSSYCRGVARLVLLEDLRAPERRMTEFEEARGQVWRHEGEGESDTLLAECLDRCLATLPESNRTLILRYYSEQKRRKIDDRAAMATELGVPQSALRSRAQRIRNALEKCVVQCTRRLEGGPDDTKGPAEQL